MVTAVSSRFDMFEFDFNAQFEQAMTDTVTAKYLAVETETTGLKVKDGTDYCIGLSVAGRNPNRDNEMFSYYFPLRHTVGNITSDKEEYLFEHLLSRKRSNPIIYHNSKFDQFSIDTLGPGRSLDSVFFYDTVIMMRMVNENFFSYRLDDLAKHFLKMEGKRKSEAFQAFFAIFGWSPNFPASIMGDYCTGDTELTLYLFERIWPIFLKEGYNGI